MPAYTSESETLSPTGKVSPLFYTIFVFLRVVRSAHYFQFFSTFSHYTNAGVEQILTREYDRVFERQL